MLAKDGAKHNGPTEDEVNEVKARDEEVEMAGELLVDMMAKWPSILSTNTRNWYAMWNWRKQ